MKDSALVALRRALARQEQVLAAEDPTASSSAEVSGWGLIGGTRLFELSRAKPLCSHNYSGDQFVVP